MQLHTNHRISHTCPAGNVVEIFFRKKLTSERQEDNPSAGKRGGVYACVFDYVAALTSTCVCRQGNTARSIHNPQWFHLSTWRIVWPLWSLEYTRARMQTHTQSQTHTGIFRMILFIERLMRDDGVFFSLFDFRITCHLIYVYILNLQVPFCDAYCRKALSNSSNINKNTFSNIYSVFLSASF